MKTIMLIAGIILCLTVNSQQIHTKAYNLILEDSKAETHSGILSVDAKPMSFPANPGAIDPAYFESTETDSTLTQTSFKNLQNKSNYSAFITAGIFGTSDGNVPFWMRSMKYGNVPTNGISFSLLGGLKKDYESTNRPKLMDWGAGFESRVNAGNHSNFIILEAYAKIRLSIFELKGGRFREQIGLVDSTLSSGAFSLSGNALGIPKIEAGIPEFWNVPLTNEVIAIKGNLAHGWMGTQLLNENVPDILIGESDAYLHQLTAYGRIGKPQWKIRLYGGLNHLAMWGNENQIFPEWGLSDVKVFKYVLLGKKYGTATVPSSKIGNHLGSIDQALELETDQILFTGYHQFFYDVGALAKLANVKDGLWGISLKNRQSEPGAFYWNKLLFEFFDSKSQGGEIDSKPRPSGAENYYNNFLYYYGWFYKGENIGNPLLTSKKYLKEGYPTTEDQYFPNTRIIAFHGGTEFKYNDWHCSGLLTYSINLGAYATSPAERKRPDIIVYHDPPYFPKLKQLSAFFESHRELQNGFEIGIQMAIDQGDLLYNSVGGGITLTKRW